VKKVNLSILFSKIVLFGFLFVSLDLISQSYPPPVGHEGSKAIFKDSSIIKSWANEINVERGFVQISDTTIYVNGSNRASFGVPENALHKAGGNSLDVVSLGDGGNAILTFSNPIVDGEGYDFAVFENSVTDDFLELAFVEVSSDGIHYFRFPSHSETQVEEQVYTFGSLDCRMINNLAGTYRQGYGTPFDLSEIPENENLDKQNIKFVKIIDVIGSIDSTFGSYDSFGNIINDPYPTPFESGGFDLDAVGVINQKFALTNPGINFSRKIELFPNPFQEHLSIKSDELFDVKLVNNLGQLISQSSSKTEHNFATEKLSSGIYFVVLTFETHEFVCKISKF
jgi:hypothetical protein